MTDEPKAAPPGWYPTPDGRRRYWDGRQWTNHFTTAAPYLGSPYAPKKSGALKWVLLAVGLILVVGGGAWVALLASAGSGGDWDGGVFVECNPEAVQAFESLPAYRGVEVDLQGSAGIGCTDTVQPADPAAYIDHYERVMRVAGWQVARDGEGLRGTGPAGPVRIDHYEGNDVMVFLPSADDFPPGEP